MGGAVSSGRDNNELVDNLVSGNFIRTHTVEAVFRALDRALYMTPTTRDLPYKDLAWRSGPLHLSAPCIYSEVMEGLELKPGLTFLNIGSGTGYLSTLVGLILGSSGVNHGVEVNHVVFDYAYTKLIEFQSCNNILDEFDFCQPKFFCGNGLCLTDLVPYDRVYCGAGCPQEYRNYFKQLIKIGGILVMPLEDNLLQVRRVTENEWVSKCLLNVSFATLKIPTKEEATEYITLDEQTPPKLLQLARSVIRRAVRSGVYSARPELREPSPPTRPPKAKRYPRRICIPLDDYGNFERFNAIHGLDREGGANEMNSLLSLVLNLGQNRVGDLRPYNVNLLESDLSSESDLGDGIADTDGNDEGNGEDDEVDTERMDGRSESLDSDPDSSDSDHDDNDGAGCHVRVLRDCLRGQAAVQVYFADEDKKVEGDSKSLDSDPESSDHGAGDSAGSRVRALRERLRDQTAVCNGVQVYFAKEDKTPSTSKETNSNTDKPKDDSTKCEKDSCVRDYDEVEIYLGKVNIPGTSREGVMEWEETDGPAEDNKSDETKDKSNENSKIESEETKEISNENSQETSSVDLAMNSQEAKRGYSEETQMKQDTKNLSTESRESEEHSSLSKHSQSDTKESKRQKFDSGIGDDNTPSSECSLGAGESSSRSDSAVDETDDNKTEGRTRLPKRSRRQASGQCSSSTEGDTDGESDDAGEGGKRARRSKRRAMLDAAFAIHQCRTEIQHRKKTRANEDRRVRLSRAMQRAVQELPLPYKLKQYVNFGRCF